MDVQTDAGSAGGEAPAIVNAPVDTPATLSTSDAARILRSARKPPETPAAPVEAAAEESTTQVDDAAPQPEVPGETQAQPEPEAEQLSPIEPPRSWTKAEKERFSTLPRETQEYLAEREQERDRAVRQSQNEAAEKLKGLTAKEQAVEQARQQYETALPQLFQTLQAQQAGEFSDIKSIADIERLAREDWPRYLQWDLSQKKIAAVQQEMQSAQQRQVQEKQQQFTEFAKRQDDLFKDKVPDMADPEKAAKLQKVAMAMLTDIGFDDSELAQAWHGQKDLSLRDHRVQLLIRDAALWREAQAKAKTATAKPVPPVHRPGVTRPSGATRDAEIQALTQRLERTGSAKDAAALLRAQRAAR